MPDETEPILTRGGREPRGSRTRRSEMIVHFPHFLPAHVMSGCSYKCVRSLVCCHHIPPRSVPLIESEMTAPFILLLGKSGSGKSTFVNTAIPGANAPVSQQLESMTGAVNVHRSGLELDLVDTPGFNSSGFGSDDEILQKIIDWVDSQVPVNNRADVRCGVLFIHEGERGGATALGMLQEALESRNLAVHQLKTSTSAYKMGLFYNGHLFKFEEAGEEATSFCLREAKAALDEGLSAFDLLEELKKVQNNLKFPLPPPFELQQLPFERHQQSFERHQQPFERHQQPFERHQQPFERHKQIPFSLFRLLFGCLCGRGLS
ncbi:hypothetical protein BKA70DRAFT_1205441 [Coprinopsis sp. MPI-PUGE-AT-0042]|nr:hypothetical protein BKA70DRAFT_1205441 [Coprinopsis sp. MPI-PUGE-AT-0042]